MAGKIKALYFAEGIEVENPNQIGVASEALVSYATTAEYEAAHSLVAGSIFWDTTLKTTRYYNGTQWLPSERDLTKEPTGFTNNTDIVVSYNSGNRTITLTGTFAAYYRGELVSTITNGWVSPAHSAGSGNYFLYYDGSSFNWVSPASINFSYLLIAYVIVTGSTTLAVREVHGLLQHEAHKLAHETIGTYVKSGGDLSAYTLDSGTATDRRPQISSTAVIDEDLQSTLPALSTNAYAWFFLSGTDTPNITVDNAEIISITGVTPNYNQFTLGAWTQTAFANNQYGKIFVMAVPSADDSTSTKSRYIFIQPQTVNTSLATIQAITPSSVNLGQLNGMIPEFVYIAEIIIRRQGGGANWRIVSVSKLTGTRYLQSSSPAGTFLSSVATDGVTVTGNGTPGDPITAIALTNPMTTAGDIIVGGTSGTPERLAKGVDGKILKMASGAVSWQDDVGFANPMTTGGDIIYGGTSGAPTRLANGTAGKVLVAKGGTTAPAWENLFVGVSAKKNGSQTIPGTGTDTTITGWTEDFDTDSAFNASTGVFTVPVAGYYQLSAHIEFDSGVFTLNETVRAGLKINGSIGVYLNDFVIRETATTVISVPCPPYAHNYSFNDTIELTIFQNTGGNRTVSSSGVRTWLSIVKLGNIVS